MFKNDGADSALLILTANLKEASGTFTKEVGFNQADDFNDALKVEGNICTQQPTQHPGDCQFDRDNVNMANGIKDLELGIALPT